ncbi:hypothetical protein Tdes44962_MAKER01605 [Teratosphaeria destructans]|uniref:Uncharacterized protein n=1 Tax=Teratosphaeria destructans TaxID=418781 RepID=A0A9W7W622_9PEZI|nr:hypothetical protein Tdes44962_MAKER01605 [Teratosphaeria destructans]
MSLSLSNSLGQAISLWTTVTYSCPPSSPQNAAVFPARHFRHVTGATLPHHRSARIYALPSTAFCAFASAFLPLGFGAARTFFSLWLALTADARATASALKSLLYPLFAVLLTTERYSLREGVLAEKLEIW